MRKNSNNPKYLQNMGISWKTSQQPKVYLNENDLLHFNEKNIYLAKI